MIYNYSVAKVSIVPVEAPATGAIVVTEAPGVSIVPLEAPTGSIFITQSVALDGVIVVSPTWFLLTIYTSQPIRRAIATPPPKYF
jgi:hypothetical protein